MINDAHKFGKHFWPVDIFMNKSIPKNTYKNIICDHFVSNRINNYTINDVSILIVEFLQLLNVF